MANSRASLRRGAIIVAALCATLTLTGCDDDGSPDDLRRLARALGARSVRTPTVVPTAPPQARESLVTCTLRSLAAPSESGSLRLELLLAADVPFTRREHFEEARGAVLALSLEGAACSDPRGVGRMVVQRDDTGSVLRLELGAEQLVTLVRLGTGPRYVLDVASERPTEPRLVVLDPGHGGADRGAQGADVDEAGVALDVAERAARWLVHYDPSLRVELTRTGDEARERLARASLANALGAGAYVSIHAGLGRGELADGLATYVLDPAIAPGDEGFVEQENGTAEGAPLSVAIGGLPTAARVGEARRLAEAVHNRVYRAVRAVTSGLANRGIQRGPLHALVGAAMPAVVVELGAPSAAGDGRRLADPRVRDAMAEGIARGLARFLAGP